MGYRAFNQRYRLPVLIGIGVLGQPQDLIRRSNRATVGMSPQAAETMAKTASLVDRVWMLKKPPDGDGREAITVGRSVDNDITIPEISISTTHCEFTVRNQKVLVVDIGSMNGTRVDGEKILPGTAVALPVSCVISLGRFEFEFLSGGRFLRRLGADREEDELEAEATKEGNESKDRVSEDAASEPKLS